MSIVEGEAKPNRPGRAKPAYPEHLARESPYPAGVKRVPVDRFFRPEYHELEVERIWRKCWQWACREEDIPEVGDYYVYEIADLSYVVVRTAPDEIKAYPNACLHRGRKLCDHAGKKAEEFRCMFHGWAWNIDGTMKDMTCGWDFPGTRDEVSRLPECKVGAWGGFVFINPDPDAEPLASFLGELPEHFEKAGIDLSKRWKQVHVAVELPVNWKVIQEAFLEAWHVNYTHPQIIRSPEHMHATGLRWDSFGNWIRCAPALPTDKHQTPRGFALIGDSDQQVLNYFYDWNDNEQPGITLAPGEHATDAHMHEQREAIRKAIGDDVEAIHDIHMHSGEMISLFPNIHPWGGFSRIVYRFRPLGNDPEKSTMEVLFLSPWPEDRPQPPPAPVHYLPLGHDISEAPELGVLARIFGQDLGNIREVQQGVKSLRSGYVILSSLNEAPVRKFHDLYDKWMGFEDGDYLAKTARP
jgi:phenylpropionate dioxygenase-like ring-hydroxylating dioxygenase large terminal subunit